MQSIGLVIPTHNMVEDLLNLIKSIEDSGLIALVDEVRIVNDASSDATSDKAKKQFNTSSNPEKWKIENLATNVGRFEARRIGAEKTKTPLLLFIDTRIELPLDFCTHLKELLKEHNCLMGLTRLRPEKSVFDLYWERTHALAFKKHYQEAEKGFWINLGNFEKYAKGTGLFLCPRDTFLEACSLFANEKIFSDDTLLMRKICESTPIFVSSRLIFYWHPRRNLLDFLLRLFQRGPGFTEYHLIKNRGLYHKVFLFFLTLLTISFVMLAYVPAVGQKLFFIGFLLLALSTFAFAKSPMEALKLMPLHVLSTLSFISGVMYSILKFRWSKGKKPAKA